MQKVELQQNIPSRNEGAIFQKKITTEESQSRRTNPDYYKLKANINELKDNRSYMQRIFGGVSPGLIKNDFRAVQEGFEKYSQFGIKIPEDILRHFEESSTVYLNDKQVARLIELVEVGEKKLEELRKKQETFGPFECKDIVFAFTKVPGTLNLLSINKVFSEMASMTTDRVRIVLTPADLGSNNEKMEFARKNNIKIKIKTETVRTIAESSQDRRLLSDFIASAQNTELLNRVEALEIASFSDIYYSIEELFKKCPNISSLSCKYIVGCGLINFPITIPASKLTSFSCLETMNRSTIKFEEQNELIDFYSHFAYGTFIFPKQLPKLERLIFENTVPRILQLPDIENLPNLKVVSFDEKSHIDTETIAQLKELQAQVEARAKTEM